MVKVIKWLISGKKIIHFLQRRNSYAQTDGPTLANGASLSSTTGRRGLKLRWELMEGESPRGPFTKTSCSCVQSCCKDSNVGTLLVTYRVTVCSKGQTWRQSTVMRRITSSRVWSENTPTTCRKLGSVATMPYMYGNLLV